MLSLEITENVFDVLPNYTMSVYISTMKSLKLSNLYLHIMPKKYGFSEGNNDLWVMLRGQNAHNMVI